MKVQKVISENNFEKLDTSKFNRLFLPMLKYLRDNKQLFFYLLLLFVSCLIRIPYFFYLSEPDFGGDIDKYYAVASYLTSEKVKTVGYPSVGYPFFLRICELIYNKAYVVVIGQNILCVFSLSLFYFGVTNFFKKYFAYVSIILIGFSTANATLVYESAYYPESILSSLLIISLALLFYFLNSKKIIILYILSFIIVLAITVRPTSLVFYMMFFLFLIWIIYTKIVTIKKGVFILTTLVFLSISFALYNFSSPIYKQFNIITYAPELSDKDIINDYYESLNLPEIKELLSIIPDNTYPFSAVKKMTNGNLDDKFEYYRNYLMYGLYFKFDGDNLIGNISSTDPIVIDSLFNGDRNYLIIKDKLQRKYKTKEMNYAWLNDDELKLANFRYFFKYFYVDKVQTESIIYDEYNKDFYSYILRIRWGGHYIYNYLGNSYLDNMKKNPNDNLFRKIMKEKKFPKKDLEDLDDEYWKMKTSLIYRLFLHPIELIQPILFRNIVYPIVYFFVFIYSLFLFVKSRGKEIVPFIAIVGCSMLLIINVLHSYHFSFLYFRYTHSVSFIYYFSMIMFPFLIFNRKKILCNAQ